MALTICNCILRIKDQLGSAFSSAELIFEPRKSQLNTSDALYINRPQKNTASPGIVIQDLIYISKSVSPSSAITVAYTGGGTAGSEVVTVVGNAISVQIESGVSTATQVKTKVDALAAASALVYCLVSGTGSNAQTTVSATSLSDYYCYLPLSETTTNTQDSIFELNWNDGQNYNSIIFDPTQIPNQSYKDLSTSLTISRG